MDLTQSLVAVMWAAAGLLLAGGVAKLRNPLDPIPAIRAVGLPVHRLLVVALGVVEIVLAATCVLATSTIPLVLMGALYLAFAVFIARLVATDAPGVSCGCAGRRYIPPSYVHAVLNLFAGVAILLVALDPPPSLIHIAARNGGFAVTTIIVGTIGMAWAAYLVVAYVPTLFTSWREAS